jgi:hypothetical protein
MSNYSCSSVEHPSHRILQPSQSYQGASRNLVNPIKVLVYESKGK